MELKCELPKPSTKTRFWWSQPHPLDVWIEEKYKFCRYEILKAIQDFDGDNKINGNIYPIILAIFSRNNRFMSDVQIDTKSLFLAYQYFTEIVAEINQYYLFIPSKQNFCSFLNITVNIFNENILNSPDAKMQAVGDTINDYLISTLAHAGQMGSAKASVTSLMLKAEDAGAGIMTAREKTSADLSKKKLDYDEITQKLKAITSTIPTISSGD